MLGVERCIGRSLIARGLLTGADVGTPRMLRNGCHVGRLNKSRWLQWHGLRVSPAGRQGVGTQEVKCGARRSTSQAKPSI
jgi:hypothetical protein